MEAANSDEVPKARVGRQPYDHRDVEARAVPVELAYEGRLR